MDEHRASNARDLGAIRVMDCSAGIAAAYCAKMFADAGAVSALLTDADVVIIDADPVTGALVGPDPQQLHAGRADLVVVAITPYGLVGPFAGRPASELTVQADSGALAISGRADRPPVQAGGQITDWVTGAFAAAAALAAVRGRATSGHGALLDVSWAEVANMTLRPAPG